ncbi:MAG: hypothetical protein Q9217_000132 [Psora testacea]
MDLTHFHDYVMDPYQAKTSIDAALKTGEQTWRRECARIYDDWLRAMGEVCVKKLNEGSMDVNGRVYGSGMVQGNLWEEAGCLASPFGTSAGREGYLDRNGA